MKNAIPLLLVGGIFGPYILPLGKGLLMLLGLLALIFIYQGINDHIPKSTNFTKKDDLDDFEL